MSEITNQATANAVSALIAQLRATVVDVNGRADAAISSAVELAESLGPYTIRDSKAQADSLIASTDVGIVYVLSDETRGGCRVWYRKQSANASSLDFVANLDWLFEELRDAGAGAGLVAYGREDAYPAGSIGHAVKNVSHIAGSSGMAFIEQYVTGLFGRGMTENETPYIATERVITASAASGSTSLQVSDGTHYLAGGCVTLQHANGRYGTYFVSGKSSNGLQIDIKPSLKSAVAAGAKIERTWFDPAHPGKFYIRELAQRIAHSAEPSCATGVADRTMFVASSVGSDDGLLAVGNVFLYRYAASSEGSDAASPVRWPYDSLHVENLSVNEGIETKFFKIAAPSLQARVLVAAPGNAYLSIQAVDERGIVLAAHDVPKNQYVPQECIFNIQAGKSKFLKLRVICAGNATGSFVFCYADLFKAPESAGKIIAKRDAKIVCVGDSWIAGNLADTLEREPLTQQLSVELPYATIINAGVGGDDVTRVLARFDSDVAVHSPDYVIVNLGTNDAYNPASETFEPNAVDYFIEKYSILIAKIKSIGARPVIVGVPALAQSDVGREGWMLNDRTRIYAQEFLSRLSEKPEVNGAQSGLVAVATDGVVTSGVTPSVAQMRSVELGYAAPTVITDLLGAVKGQVVTLLVVGAPVTLLHGNFKLHGGVSVTLNQYSTITLQRLDPAQTFAWVELSRSVVMEDRLLVDADGSTPSVRGAHDCVVNYSTTTSINNLLHGEKGQIVSLRFTGGNVTLLHGDLLLQGSANVTPSPGSIVTLQRLDPLQTSAWIELSRSIK